MGSSKSKSFFPTRVSTYSSTRGYPFILKIKLAIGDYINFGNGNRENHAKLKKQGLLSFERVNSLANINYSKEKSNTLFSSDCEFPPSFHMEDNKEKIEAELSFIDNDDRVFVVLFSKKEKWIYSLFSEGNETLNINYIGREKL